MEAVDQHVEQRRILLTRSFANRQRRPHSRGDGHWFTKIDDHIDYLMIRIDPDKVTPLKDAAQSKEYLAKPAPVGQ